MDFSKTGCGHAHLPMMRKNFPMITAPVAWGYSWHTLATNIAHATPPGNPITLAYIARRWAHNLIPLSAVRKVFCCGTRSRISSVTLVPFNDRRSLSSKPLNRLVSFKLRPSGTEGIARRAKIRSMLIPESSSLIIGTKASGTGVISWIAPRGVIFRRMTGKSSKKSSRKTCFGTTTRVSISEPRSSQRLRVRNWKPAFHWMFCLPGP